MSSLSRAGKMSLTFAKPAPPELSVDDIIRDIQRQVIKFKCRLIDIFQVQCLLAAVCLMIFVLRRKISKD